MKNLIKNIKKGPVFVTISCTLLPLYSWLTTVPASWEQCLLGTGQTGCGSRSKWPHLCCRWLTYGWDFKPFFLGMGWFTESMRAEQWEETNHDLGKTLLSETQFAGLWKGDSGSALEDTREIQWDDVATMPRPGRSGPTTRLMMCGLLLNLTLGTRGGKPLHTGGLSASETPSHMNLGEALQLSGSQFSHWGDLEDSF